MQKRLIYFVPMGLNLAHSIYFSTNIKPLSGRPIRDKILVERVLWVLQSPIGKK